MKKFVEGEEVMLLGPLMTGAAHADGYNPYYLLVVRDCGVSFQGQWDVICLCEDGRERAFSGHDLKSLSELEESIRPKGKS